MRIVTIIVFFALALAAGGMMFAPGVAKWAALLFAGGALFLAYVIWSPRGRAMFASHTSAPIPETGLRHSQQPGEEAE